jgi:hypothetical protein
MSGRWEDSYAMIATSAARLTQRVPWLCVPLSREVCLYRLPCLRDNGLIGVTSQANWAHPVDPNRFATTRQHDIAVLRNTAWRGASRDQRVSGRVLRQKCGHFLHQGRCVTSRLDQRIKPLQQGCGRAIPSQLLRFPTPLRQTRCCVNRRSPWWRSAQGLIPLWSARALLVAP